MTFQRENRYIVIKRKDLDAAAAEGAVDASFAEVLDIVSDSLPTRECLVIERDWPEYEPAWRMIQARVEGATLSPAHVEDEEEVEVVGHLLLCAPFSSEELGDIDVEWDFKVAERLQRELAINDDVSLPLMTVAQHERIVAALVARNEWLEQVAVDAAETEKHALQVADAYRSGAALSAPPAAGVLEQMSEEARSTLVGMVEFCLERRYCMGMDEGFASFEPETEHGFVKELRAFVEGAPTPPASEQQQAVQQPHTVEFVGKTCQRVLMAEGKPYPRTCAVCGLSGPCKSFPRESDLRLNPHLAGVNQGVTTEAGNGGDA
ncbi:hypothetical protein [Pseudomonas sp. 2023EL-01195]|uniref:hypothetical protein n=1 Tax=Pseudomonas sp. 2023EL-01195 TaxID=3088134 RepID=UPI00296B527E|nr:hypothetical protein [Pseudomonas sp. 2023EL-01195]MDW3712896.1 hypothetical protein [Pseudomonas sp. 2023EL-01195]